MQNSSEARDLKFEVSRFEVRSWKTVCDLTKVSVASFGLRMSDLALRNRFLSTVRSSLNLMLGFSRGAGRGERRRIGFGLNHLREFGRVVIEKCLARRRHLDGLTEIARAQASDDAPEEPARWRVRPALRIEAHFGVCYYYVIVSHEAGAGKRTHHKPGT